MATLRRSLRFIPISAGVLAWVCAHVLAQTPSDRKTFKLRGQEQMIFPREKLIARGLTVPEIPDDQNAAWVYVDAINAFAELPGDLQEAQDAVMASGKWPEGDAGQRLADWLDQNADAIALTRKAATMPQYYMPMVQDPASDSLVSALLPTMSHMRNLARLMAVSAARKRASNPDVAVDDAITLQRLAHHAAHGTTLIEGMVGMAIGAVAEKSLRWSIDDNALSAEKLADVGAELDKLAATQPDWERMVRAEEKLSEGHVDDMMDASGTLPALLNPYAAFGERMDLNPSGWKILGRRLKRLYLPDRLMKEHSRAYYDRLIATARDEARIGGLQNDEDRLLGAVPVWNVIGRMMLPAISRTHDVVMLRRANFERTRVTVAAAAYKKAHGQFPARLADLAPAYISSVPKDPLTGRELEYAPAADGKSHTGLEPIDGDRARAFYDRGKSQPAGGAAGPVHPWRLLVKEYTDRYQFDEAQRTAADAIFRELEARSAAYVKSLAANQKPDPEVEEQFTSELIRRLSDLPTQAQRAAASKQGK